MIVDGRGSTNIYILAQFHRTLGHVPQRELPLKSYLKQRERPIPTGRAHLAGIAFLLTALTEVLVGSIQCFWLDEGLQSLLL